jgi:hypothetical protein
MELSLGLGLNEITQQGTVLNQIEFANSTQFANSSQTIVVGGVTKTIKEFFDQLNTEFELLFNDQVFF